MKSCFEPFDTYLSRLYSAWRSDEKSPTVFFFIDTPPSSTNGFENAVGPEEITLRPRGRGGGGGGGGWEKRRLNRWPSECSAAAAADRRNIYDRLYTGRTEKRRPAEKPTSRVPYAFPSAAAAAATEPTGRTRCGEGNRAARVTAVARSRAPLPSPLRRRFAVTGSRRVVTIQRPCVCTCRNRVAAVVSVPPPACCPPRNHVNPDPPRPKSQPPPSSTVAVRL